MLSELGRQYFAFMDGVIFNDKYETDVVQAVSVGSDVNEFLGQGKVSEVWEELKQASAGGDESDKQVAAPVTVSGAAKDDSSTAALRLAMKVAKLDPSEFKMDSSMTGQVVEAEAEAKDILSMSCVFINGSQGIQEVIRQLHASCAGKKGSQQNGQALILYDAKAR